MNAYIERMINNQKIPYEDIHVYVFADERGRGWGSSFIEKAINEDSLERHTLIDSAVSDGIQLYESGKLTVVLPCDWLHVFRIINKDVNTLRPALNWMAEEYLIFRQIIAEELPEDKKQTDWALVHGDNFVYVVYYVDTKNRKIIDKRG